MTTTLEQYNEAFEKLSGWTIQCYKKHPKEVCDKVFSLFRIIVGSKKSMPVKYRLTLQALAIIKSYEDNK